ncbi:glycosyltransferase [Synoicihabitans lomoniglobus]|uniref:Glycosyltransferase n=1 Tax=Synoicihabitans lomoniglobus TaxID=2909285 RepID=A0AAF0CQW0_9BACT|nr:glycosyltransferase [Opitutaceae bacterium LMO-M01]WED66364.1 glycosyltransferase [Opitutaceae bacterium LMO-M01]
MRHLHFVQSIEPLQGGGLGRSALDLHLALLERGVVSRLLATREKRFMVEWPETVQGRRKGISKAYYSPEIAGLLGAEVRCVDVVHGHGFYTALNWMVGGAAHKLKLPLVYHPHGMLDPWILKRSRVKKRFVRWWFEDRNFRAVRCWRALTSKEADQIRAAGHKGAIEVVPNGVDPAALTPSTLPRSSRDGRKRILFLARLHPKKGAALLVEAWAKLATRFPDWEIAIHGPDEGGHAAEIAAAIKRFGLGATCQLHVGAVRDEKWTLFDAADIFVLPSYSEGFPVAVLEAAARGRPVVMTTECNFPELGTAGGAWICRPEASELGASLEAAMNASDTERRQRGEIGRKLIQQSYTWDRLAEKVDEACRLHC